MGGERSNRVLLALVTSWVVPAKSLVELIRRAGCARVEELGLGGISEMYGLAAGERESLEQAFESAPEVERALKEQGASVLWLGGEGYPRLLADIAVPPAALFVRGDVSGLDAPAVAVVGSRRASAAGAGFAGDLAADLAAHGFTVVSGLARGIDTAAHRGALRAGGRTLAVLGSGIDLVYPPENRQLAGEISGAGAVLSEHAPGVEPLPWHFPLRNRIISGLSMGTVVVEAAVRSGALVTARCALEQNRSVFAVPGKPGDPRSGGVNRLIKDGARLVEGVDDVLDELTPQIGLDFARAEKPGRPEAAAGVSAVEGEAAGVEGKVMDMLSEVPTHVDEISAGMEMEAGELLGLLLTLETRGLVKSLPGKFYVRG
jgi:DNA processing protein